MRQKSIDISGFGHGVPIPAASRVGPILATSAIAGVDRSTGEVPEDIDGQIKHMFENLKAILAEAGMDMGDVVKFDVTVTEDGNRKFLDKYWLENYPDAAKRPARHTGVGEIRGGRLVNCEVLAVAKSLG